MEAVDKYIKVLEVGKCYLISNGKIKPANKKYTSIRNDYQINISQKEGDLKVCEEDDNIKNP